MILFPMRVLFYLFFSTVIPIAIVIIATIAVWWLYWRETQDIAAPIETKTDKGDEEAPLKDEEAAEVKE